MLRGGFVRIFGIHMLYVWFTDGTLTSFVNSSNNDSQERKTANGTSVTFRDLTRQLYRTLLPSTAAKGVRRCIGFARRRVGRGGRFVSFFTLLNCFVYFHTYVFRSARHCKINFF